MLTVMILCLLLACSGYWSLPVAGLFRLLASNRIGDILYTRVNIQRKQDVSLTEELGIDQ